MTRDEAIEEIKQVRFNLNCQLNGTSRFEEAFEMAIKALEQQTCEDAVSREAVLDLFAKNCDTVRPYNKTWEEVKALPSVNPQPKMGSKDVIWYGKRNYSEIVVEPRERR